MWLINVSSLQLPGRGRSCYPGNYICVFMTRKRSTRPLCSLQQESWKTFSPLFPPVWLHFYLPNGGCALTFAGINLLVYLNFPSLICLNEINGHSLDEKMDLLQICSAQKWCKFVAKFIPNWNCHYWVPQQTELTQSETPPAAITTQWYYLKEHGA